MPTPEPPPPAPGLHMNEPERTGVIMQQPEWTEDPRVALLQELLLAAHRERAHDRRVTAGAQRERGKRTASPRTRDRRLAQKRAAKASRRRNR